MRKIVNGIICALCTFILTMSHQSCNKDDEFITYDDFANIRVNLADPFILVADSAYYAYGTLEKDGIAVYTSTNLVEWYRMDSLALHKSASFGDTYFWAPEIYRNRNDNMYYMFYSAQQHLCVSRSSSPTGPFYQSIMTSMLETRAIDPTIFMESESTYIYYVDSENGNQIYVSELTNDWINLKHQGKFCFGPNQDWEFDMGAINEGPGLIKYKDLYYMIYSACGYESKDYAIGYAVAENPIGPWIKYKGNPILRRPKINGQTLYGTGHGSIFTDLEGNLRLVFHAHNSEDRVHPRCMYITSVHFTDEKVPKLYFGEDIIRPICISK